MRLVDITTPVKDLSTVLLSSKAGADDRMLVNKLTDLLEKCLILDPSKRLKVSDALKHPFFQSSHHSNSTSNSSSNNNNNINSSNSSNNNK